MATIRVDNRKTFTTLNRALINDSRLSLRARGLLVWLLDKPDGWRVESVQIAKATTEGRDAVRAALSELVTAGYLTRARIKDDLGRWTMESVVREHPALTGDGIPGPGEPAAGEPGDDTKTVTEDCYPLNPPHCFTCGGCPRAGDCRIVSVQGEGTEEACPWSIKAAS